MTEEKFKPVKTCVLAIIEKENKILLTKRSIEPFLGKWCFPGGHIEFGEEAVNAIKREVKEEIGVDLQNPKFLFYHEEYMPEVDKHTVILVFHEKIKENPSPLDEVSEIKWFSKEEIKNTALAFRHNKIVNKYLDLK